MAKKAKKKASRKAPVVKTRRARVRAAGEPQPSPRASPVGKGSKSLARDLLALYQDLGKLSRATKVKREREELRAQQESLGVLIDQVIASTIREDTRAYAEATASLVAAAASAEAALEDVKSVVGAIIAAARVIDAVGRVVSAAMG